MNHKSIKKVTRVILAVVIAASGFAIATNAQAEMPADVSTQPTKGEAALPLAPVEPSAGETVAPPVLVISSAGDIKRPRQPESVIEVGIGKTSADSYMYGDYKGLEKSKPYLITNVLLNRRGEDNLSYLELNARNLGLESRNIKIRGGKQGDYGMRFEYDELTRLRSDSYQTPYSGMGSSVLSKPAVWNLNPVVGAPAFIGTSIMNTQNMTDLAANMKRFNVQTQRKALGLGVNKTLPDGWYVAANFKREKKDGTKLTGAAMQLDNRGGRGAVIIPEPINYNTDQFEVLMRRASEKLNLQFGYYASLFSNANQSTTFDSLYLGTNTYTPSTLGGNALTGRLGQMPDNQFHQLNVSGGYTLTDATRLTGSLSRGRMTQNQAFLPYTTQNIMPATTSLNGKIDTTHADLKLNSRLTRALNLSAGYKYDDRHNRTAVNEYTYQTADNTLAIAPAIPGNSQNIRRNTPLSNTKQALYADLDYHLTAATKLKLGYDFEKVAHTYEPTKGDREHTVKAEISHNFGDTASAGLGLARSDRKASAYDGAAPLADTYTAAYLASLCNSAYSFLYNGVTTPCTGANLTWSATTGAATGTNATYPWLDTPALQKYFMTNRKRDKLHVFANAAATDQLDLQFDANYSRDKFPNNETGFGLTRAVNWAANLQAKLAASDTVSGTFYTTLEDYSTDQNGHNGGQGAIAFSNPLNSNPNQVLVTNLDRQNNTALFDVRTGTTNRKDRSLTLGLGFNVKPGGSLDWGGDLTHTTTTGSTSFSNLGIGIAPGGIATAIAPATPAVVLPMPDVVTRLSRLELFGKYQLQKDMTLNMRYAYEKYASKDWAWDGQTLTSSTSLVGTNQTSPKYHIHMINISLSYMF